MAGVNRPSFLSSYVNSISIYLKAQFPNYKDDQIRDFVVDYIRNNIKRPKAEIVNYPSYGNQELKKVDLLKMIKDTSSSTIAPGGTVFTTVDINVPNNKEFLDTLVARRDKAKKEMFKFIEQNKKLEADAKNSEQALNKIAANSVSGGHGTALNALYDLETYCSITSLCRHGTMIAYTFAERFLAGNFYFPEFEDAINYVITTVESCPSDQEVNALLEKYNLHQVWPEELAELLISGMYKYIVLSDSQINFLYNEVCNKLSPAQCSYVYYSRHLYGLFDKNQEVMTNFFVKLFTLHEDSYCMNREDADISLLKSSDEDLIQAAQTIYNDFLGGRIIKNLPKEAPDLAISMAKILKTFQEILDYWNPVWDLFIHSKTMVSKAHINKNMIRKVIIVSDTDSIIFTSKHLVTKFLGGTFTYNNKYVYSAHALIVYFLCKSVASLLRMVAIQRGAIGENNIKMLKMKNEFFYPVFIRTNVAKHYIGLMTVREGIVLPEPTWDVKGVLFRTSNVPKITHEFTDKLIVDITNDINTNTNIYVGDYLSRCLSYEKFIYDSINKGEQTYFVNVAIKEKGEYKNPDISIYSNYLLWQDVFAKKYGDIYIPTKCTLIPFIKNKYKDPEYLSWLEMRSPSIHKKWVKYIESNPKKKITRMPIPVTCLSIPDELIPLIDIRSIIFKNMGPAQLILKSLGFDLGNSKKQPLLSDYYTELLE